MQSPQNLKEDSKKKVSNLVYAGIAGTAGCLTLVIVVGAVIMGLWLDFQFQSKPIITILLVILSIPVSVLGMFALVRASISRINP